jgi:hypothetical protein
MLLAAAVDVLQQLPAARQPLQQMTAAAELAMAATEMLR